MLSQFSYFTRNELLSCWTCLLHTKWAVGVVKESTSLFKNLSRQPSQNVPAAGYFAAFSPFLAACSTLDFTNEPSSRQGDLVFAACYSYVAYCYKTFWQGWVGNIVPVVVVWPVHICSWVVWVGWTNGLKLASCCSCLCRLWKLPSNLTSQL